MNEELMFKEVLALCKANGVAIDKIAHDCNINQNLVAKMFIATMEEILKNVDVACKNSSN